MALREDGIAKAWQPANAAAWIYSCGLAEKPNTIIMTTTKLIRYAALGIISGLLLENSGLRLRQAAGKKARQLKKKAGDKAADVADAVRKTAKG